MSSELKDAYFLRDLAPRELGRIAAVARERHFPAGTSIVRGGEELSALHVLRSGRVRVIVPIEKPRETGGAEDLIVALGPGECFGEFSYADRKPSSATLVADEDTETFEIPHLELDEVLGSDAAIARKVLKAMLVTVVERLRATDADLVLARYILRYV